MADGDLRTGVSRDEADNTTSNVLWTGISDDGGNAVTVTGNALDVNATVTLETAYADNSTEFTIDTDDVNAQGFIVEETATPTVTEGNIGIARMTEDRKMIIEIADATTDANRLAVNSDGSINVSPAIVVSGTEVNDYDTATVAAAGTSNHDYTVVNANFLCERVSFGGSGRMKIEVQSGPVAGLVSQAVRFTKRDTSDDQVFSPALVVPVASTGTLRVIRTNRSVGSLDVYSTIMGEDIT